MVKSVVFCAPLIAATAALGQVQVTYCNPPGAQQEIKGSRIGESIYDGTSSMRKADFVPLSQAIRNTASCFEARGDLESKSKAKSQLEALKSSELFPKLPEQEKSEINSALGRLDNFH
jgi:hypothetical protein